MPTQKAVSLLHEALLRLGLGRMQISRAEQLMVKAVQLLEGELDPADLRELKAEMAAMDEGRE
jgi:hypothetical protein